MKPRRDLLSCILDALGATLMAVAGVACLMTAFSFEADLTAVVIAAAVFATGGVMLSRLRWGWLLLWPLLALGIWCLHLWELETNLGSALHRILVLYNRGYGWDIPEFLTECEEWDLTPTMQSPTSLVSADFPSTFTSQLPF